MPLSALEDRGRAPRKENTEREGKDNDSLACLHNLLDFGCSFKSCREVDLKHKLMTERHHLEIYVAPSQVPDLTVSILLGPFILMVKGTYKLPKRFSRCDTYGTQVFMDLVVTYRLFCLVE